MTGLILSVLLVAVVSLTTGTGSGQSWRDSYHYRDVRQAPVAKGFWSQDGNFAAVEAPVPVPPINPMPAPSSPGPGPRPRPTSPAPATSPPPPNPGNKEGWKPVPGGPDQGTSSGGSRGSCYTTGCAPVGLPAYCPANVRELSRKQCIARGSIDVTCCPIVGGGGGSSSGTNTNNAGSNRNRGSGISTTPAPWNGNQGGGSGGRSHDPSKGYWDVNGRCNWTGCAPKGLPAYCGAGQRESGRQQCNDPSRVDVKCC